MAFPLAKKTLIFSIISIILLSATSFDRVKADCKSSTFSKVCKNIHYFPFSTYMSANCSHNGTYIPTGVYLRNGVVYNETLGGIQCGIPYPGNLIDRRCTTSLLRGGTVLTAQCLDFVVTSTSWGFQIHNSTIDVSQCIGVTNHTSLYFCG